MSHSQAHNAITADEIRANVARLPVPDGWTRADDLALVEGLADDLRLMQVALAMRKTYDQVADRYMQLRRASVREPGRFEWGEYARLFGVLKGMAA